MERIKLETVFMEFKKKFNRKFRVPERWNDRSPLRNSAQFQTQKTMYRPINTLISVYRWEKSLRLVDCSLKPALWWCCQLSCLPAVVGDITERAAAPKEAPHEMSGFGLCCSF